MKTRLKNVWNTNEGVNHPLTHSHMCAHTLKRMACTHTAPSIVPSTLVTISYQKRTTIKGGLDFNVPALSTHHGPVKMEGEGKKLALLAFLCTDRGKRKDS